MKLTFKWHICHSRSIRAYSDKGSENRSVFLIIISLQNTKTQWSLQSFAVDLKIFNRYVFVYIIVSDQGYQETNYNNSSFEFIEPNSALPNKRCPCVLLDLDSIFKWIIRILLKHINFYGVLGQILRKYVTIRGIRLIRLRMGII